jgi:hypothetical protein
VIIINKISRIYPEAKMGLINWVEQNFHDIDQFVATFSLQDGTTMTVYDCYSFLEAMGIVGISQSTVNALAYDEEFISKKRL